MQLNRGEKPVMPEGNSQFKPRRTNVGNPLTKPIGKADKRPTKLFKSARQDLVKALMQSFREAVQLDRGELQDMPEGNSHPKPRRTNVGQARIMLYSDGSFRPTN